eukprot:g64772.t1
MAAGGRCSSDTVEKNLNTLRGGKCPVGFGGDSAKDPGFSSPSDVGDYFPDASRLESQRKELPTQAEASNIPKAPKDGQEYAGETWIYPSPQRFFNAMARKGHDPDEDDMETIVNIHNNINERAWQQILEWEEELHPDCKRPMLSSFEGKPDELSLRARFYSITGIRSPPFDRHDWTVDRCGRKVRYIIDFYTGRSIDPFIPAVYLDVRPSLTLGGVWDRARMFTRQTMTIKDRPYQSNGVGPLSILEDMCCTTYPMIRTLRAMT